MPPSPSLVSGYAALCAEDPALPAFTGIDPASLADDGALIVAVLTRALHGSGADAGLGALLHGLLAPDLLALLGEDIAVTALRDADPLGKVGSLLFANGLHCLLGYRFGHALHRAGRDAAALALKTRVLRAFGADIMPAARIGRRVWIDHGLGIVIGQTAVIGDDVSLWHGVTLGTNLVDRGPARHPRIEDGAVIGAGAKLIGPITIGAGAVVASGAVVTETVAPASLAVGPRARLLPGRARSHADLQIPIGELE
ncbi:serine O-acetyltransferase [Acidimangrovimonas sediminis]|uniref:serine O-acetyltransferase n=1 Tax=Acidimangrovimonas sediminis TaxID=2056283 RepID=UPI000C8096CB|nr:serine O-acetyltransferase [Acidimangrovimonas sediminis]